MRWNAAPPSRFDGALAAVPVTLLSRDEDVHHPVHLYSRSQGSSRRALPSKAVVPTATAAPREPRRPSMATPTETIRLSTTVVPTPRSVFTQKPPASARELSPRAMGLQDEEPQTGALQDEPSEAYEPKFLVCAGRALNSAPSRGLSNNNDDDTDGECGGSVGRPPSCVGGTSSDTASEPLRSQRGLQRSDSELELIISELREKIALQQRQSTPRSTEDDPSTATDRRPGSAHQHSRKHLKNPLERMDMSSSSASLLRRQASASQVTASRLVSEGSATMVTPAVLSSSASRGGGDTATSQMPHFVSSTSLGLNLPSQQQPIRSAQSSAYETTDLQSLSAPQTRPSRPRLRTLADLELELERLNVESRCADASESLSPVGPWLVDHDSNNSAPLASSRSTGSLPPSPSSAQLALTPPEEVALSPRSRLLWLSDCGSDDAWESTSARVFAMLRPGTRAFPNGGRPASALETRRLSNSRLAAKTPTAAKPRAVSAKAALAGRRNSSHSTTSAHESSSVSGATTASNASKNHRTRRNSSSSSASSQRIR